MTLFMAQAVFFGVVELVGAARVKQMPVKIHSPDFTKYGSWFGGDMFKSNSLKEIQAGLEVSDDMCTWSREFDSCIHRITGQLDSCEYGMRKRGAERHWWKPSFLSTKCNSWAKDACCLAKRANRPDGVVSAEFVMAATKVLRQALQLEETRSSFLINYRLMKLVKSIEVLRRMADSSENQRMLSATTRLFLSNATSLSLWLDFSADSSFWTKVVEHHNKQFPNHLVEKDVVESLLATNEVTRAKLNKEWSVSDGEDDSPMAWVAKIIGETMKKMMDKMNMPQEQRDQIRATLEEVQGETSLSASDCMKGLEESTELAEAGLDDVDDALDDPSLVEMEHSSLIEMDPWTKVFLIEGGAFVLNRFFTGIFNMLKFIVMLPYILVKGTIDALVLSHEVLKFVVIPVIEHYAFD